MQAPWSDIDKHLILDGRYLPWPAPWSAIFGRSAPLIVEIGFGGADHLMWLAVDHPTANVVGIEISNPALAKAERKARHTGLQNARFLFGSADTLLLCAFAPASVSALHIHHPDPWPKAAHAHRRLVDDAFLALAASRLMPSAELHIATDHAAYQAQIEACLARTPYFEPDPAGPPASPFVSKYAQKALREGRHNRYYQWHRNAVAVDHPFAPPELTPMSHAIVRLPRTLAEIGRDFTPQRYGDDGVHVRLLAVYQAFQTDALLVEAYISQAPLDQRLAFLIQQRDDGTLLLKPHELGFPRMTRGVQFALACLLRWVVGLSADAVVVDHTLPADVF